MFYAHPFFMKYNKYIKNKNVELVTPGVLKVSFSQARDAAHAKKAMDGTIVEGLTIVVEYTS